jgi:hypothetical protein
LIEEIGSEKTNITVSFCEAGYIDKELRPQLCIDCEFQVNIAQYLNEEFLSSIGKPIQMLIV